MVVQSIDAASLSQLPIFPLPETVLFPGTALPLHIFEPRYIQMAQDALGGDHALAVVMLRDPDDALVQGKAVPVHDVACAGRIVHAENAGEGKLNILVHGIHRVQLLEELDTGKLYRSFRTELIPTPDKNSLGRAGQELARFQSCMLGLRSALGDSDEQLVEVLSATSDPIALTDILGAVLIHDPKMRQQVLSAVEIRSRLKHVIDAVADVIVRVGELPKKSRMN